MAGRTARHTPIGAWREHASTVTSAAEGRWRMTADTIKLVLRSVLRDLDL